MSNFVKADISKEEDIQKIAQHAIEELGGFDFWLMPNWRKQERLI